MEGSILQTDLFERSAPQQNDKRHRTILLDPPWPEKGGGKSKRGADRHYPTVPTKEMPALIRDSGKWNPADDSQIWLWVTNNFLEDGLWLMKQLGFRYVTNVVWVKIRHIIECPDDGALTRSYVPDGKAPYVILDASDIARSALQIGLGQYLRGSHELLLFGTHGKAMMPDKAKVPPSVIIAPRGQHSRKPDEQYPLIEAVSPGPRIEFFARRPWPRWQAWGNELDKPK